MGDKESALLQLLTWNTCSMAFKLILFKALHLLYHVSAFGIFSDYI